MAIDHDRLIYLLNNFHMMRHQAPMVHELVRMMEEVGPEIKGCYDLSIWSYFQRHPQSAPAVPSRSSNSPILDALKDALKSPINRSKYGKDTIGHILEEVYDAGPSVFEGTRDPEMLRDFCSPYSGNRELTMAELSPPQRRTFKLIQQCYREWCKKRGITPRYLSEGGGLDPDPESGVE